MLPSKHKGIYLIWSILGVMAATYAASSARAIGHANSAVLRLEIVCILQ